MYVRCMEPLYNGHFMTHIFGHFLLQYEGFALSEAKNILVTPVRTKILVIIMRVFSIVSSIRQVCLERFHL